MLSAKDQEEKKAIVGQPTKEQKKNETQAPF